ncbi:MAG: glycoside hydrolase family 97 N-terminal domain-containing protein [Bacteroidales bacterium]
MKYLYVLCFLGLLCAGCEKKNHSITSPDKNINLTFSMDGEGIPYYTVIYKNDTLIQRSRLGLHLDGNPMDSALQLKDIAIGKNKYSGASLGKEYEQPQHQYNELIAKVEKNDREMDIIFRLYNDGVAFRYWVRGYENVVISGKMMDINFADKVDAYWSCFEYIDTKNQYHDGNLDVMRKMFETALPDDAKHGKYPDSLFVNLPFLVKNGSKYMNFQIVTINEPTTFNMKVDAHKPLVSTYVTKDDHHQMVVPLPYYSQWLSIGISNNSAELLESKLVYNLSLEGDLPKEKYEHPIDFYENNCKNNVILPFSRHYEGTKEYSMMNIPKGGYSTFVHQLALHVVFNRPLSVYSDYEAYYTDKGATGKFIGNLPKSWDTMKVVDAELGRYVIVARKDSDSENWFVGGITNAQGRESVITFDFLSPDILYKATIYEDTENSHWLTNPSDFKISEMYVRKNNTFTFKMAPGGGYGVILKEVKNP